VVAQACAVVVQVCAALDAATCAACDALCLVKKAAAADNRQVRMLLFYSARAPAPVFEQLSAVSAR
jgi:hypothetical protein